MNIYLDIDGVLLANEENLAIGASELIKYAADNFSVYWLTTHCMHGDPTRAIEYIQRVIDENLRPVHSLGKPSSTRPTLFFLLTRVRPSRSSNVGRASFLPIGDSTPIKCFQLSISLQSWFQFMPIWATKKITHLPRWVIFLPE